MSVREAIRLINESLEDMAYVVAICTLWGISAHDLSDHAELARDLFERKAYYEQICEEEKCRKQQALLPPGTITSLQDVRAHAKGDKLAWKNGPVKVVCSDKKLLDFASRARQGIPLEFRKDEVGKYFDFRSAIPFWDSVPGYTLILIGGGITFSSPEYDLFQAMCWSSDEAVRTRIELEGILERVVMEGSQVEALYTTQARHRTMCIQTVVNAFFLLEAYLNSVAHLYLIDPRNTLSDELRQYLQEQAIDKRGNVRQRFVSTEDKLYEWIKIISPRGETFDRGRNPFQEFRKLREYRDAIVHLSENKVTTYNSIDHEVCKRAVAMVIEIVDAISAYIAPTPSDLQSVWWLSRPNSAGFFNLSSILPLLPASQPGIV